MGKIIWVIILFLILGVYIIHSSLQTDFSEPSDVKSFVGAVTGWVFQVGKSSYEVGKTVTDQEWLPKNTTYVIND